MIATDPEGLRGIGVGRRSNRRGRIMRGSSSDGLVEIADGTNLSRFSVWLNMLFGVLPSLINISVPASSDVASEFLVCLRLGR